MNILKIDYKYNLKYMLYKYIWEEIFQYIYQNELLVIWPYQPLDRYINNLHHHRIGKSKGQPIVRGKYMIYNDDYNVMSIIHYVWLLKHGYDNIIAIKIGYHNDIFYRDEDYCVYDYFIEYNTSVYDYIYKRDHILKHFHLYDDMIYKILSMIYKKLILYKRSIDGKRFIDRYDWNDLLKYVYNSNNRLIKYILKNRSHNDDMVDDCHKNIKYIKLLMKYGVTICNECESSLKVVLNNLLNKNDSDD